VPLSIYFPKLSVIKLIKYSFVVSLAYPVTTALLVVAIIPTTLLTYFLPQTAAFVLIAVPAYFQLVIVKPVYSRLLNDSKMLTIDDLDKTKTSEPIR
jgi:uncharacterized membrane protein YesL